MNHLTWKDRTTLTVEDDLIVFPGESSLVKVSQVTDGRVYVLKFTSSSQKHFFWIQEPNAAKDEATIAQINAALNAELDDAMDATMSLIGQEATSPLTPQLENLRQILSSVNIQDTGSSLPPKELVKPALSSATLGPILFPTIPFAASRTDEQIDAVMASPEFAQCLAALRGALNSGELSPLLEQLAADPANASIIAFLQSL